MAVVKQTAWRFEHPDFGSSEGSTGGFVLSPTGRIALVDGHEAIRQSLKLLLSTAPGERVAWPDYGCNLHLLAFSPNDETTQGLAIHYVREAVSIWEPRVDIIDIDAIADSDSPERLVVQLLYRVRETIEDGRLALSIDLMNSGT